MLNNIRVASYRPTGQGVEGYEATKTGAYGANCYWHYAFGRAAA